ncbi:uncharacterized protein LOC128193691 [Vigna angularis]|uniref:uncharacterized protein LOC128193691 n=1 Tax=Phaseolus angularis TaxID=3914 RepID=UPI0022B48CE1|nr:uncharacterized protein LOC128193691 [Vigna angularis]
MFRDARNAGQRPNWLGEHIWNSLLAHWNTVEFRNKCAKAQRNRASERGGTLHTGGSITIHEHAIRMAQALGRAVHVDEVFAQTHVRKGTNQFVDERSRKTHEDFSTRLSQVRSEHESAPTPDATSNADDDIRRTQCWIDTVGGKKKGRVSGLQRENHFSETCSAFYRRLLPFGKCPRLPITEGFRPSVNTLECSLPRASALR